MKPSEVVAGELCRDMHMGFARNDWTAELPSHIRIMLGKNEWQRPLWRDRVMPPDSRRYRLKRFEDYLTRPFREGLGFTSWWTIHAALETQGKAGVEAIDLIRKEVAAYDLKVRRDRQRTTGESWGQLADHGGDRRSEDQGDNITLKSRGTSAAYLIAKLKREAPEMAERFIAGEFRSARAAALTAGIIKPTPVIIELRRAWKRATPEDRAIFRAEITE